MAVAYITDFPGADMDAFHRVARRVVPDGRPGPGSMFLAGGLYEGGLRVIDVWDEPESFERFRAEKLGPALAEENMPEPRVRTVPVTDVRVGSGREPVLVTVTTLPGLDADTFHAKDEVISKGGVPAGMTFHVNGPVDEGWCVIGAWESVEARD